MRASTLASTIRNYHQSSELARSFFICHRAAHISVSPMHPSCPAADFTEQLTVSRAHGALLYRVCGSSDCEHAQKTGSERAFKLSHMPFTGAIPALIDLSSLFSLSALSVLTVQQQSF